MHVRQSTLTVPPRGPRTASPLCLPPFRNTQKKDGLHQRFPGIPGPRAGDNLYQLAKRTKHHGMVKVHEKYGELVQFPQPTGPILYLRGTENQLKQFFNDTKTFGKNTSTFDHLDGAVDVSNLVQPMLVDTIFEWEGPRWQAARKVINPFFTHPEVYNSTIRAVEAFLAAEVGIIVNAQGSTSPTSIERASSWNEIVDEAERKEESFEGDLLCKVHTMIKMCVVEIMGGYEMEEGDLQVLDEIIEHFIQRNMSDESMEAPTMDTNDASVFKRIIAFGHKVLAYTKAHMDTMNKKALLALMIKSGEYTDDQMVALFVNLLVAGGETPALAACKTLAAMAREPEVMRCAVDEVDASFAGEGANSQDGEALSALGYTAEALPNSAVLRVDGPHLEYIECCVMEGLRRYAPATVVGRAVSKDAELCGYKVPEGASVQVSIHAVHMNPEVWPEPEKFEPLRFDKAACAAGLDLACKGDPAKNMIAFGLGARACPGKKQYVRMCKAIIGGILRQCSVKADPVGDLDSFLPNRYVAWDTQGVHVSLKARSASLR